LGEVASIDRRRHLELAIFASLIQGDLSLMVGGAQMLVLFEVMPLGEVAWFRALFRGLVTIFLLLASIHFVIHILELPLACGSGRRLLARCAVAVQPGPEVAWVRSTAGDSLIARVADRVGGWNIAQETFRSFSG